MAAIRHVRQGREDFQQRQAIRMTRNNGQARTARVGDVVKIMVPAEHRRSGMGKFVIAMVVQVRGELSRLATSR